MHDWKIGQMNEQLKYGAKERNEPSHMQNGGGLKLALVDQSEEQPEA